MYRHLMDKVFVDHIERNVDDMVINCRDEAALLHDIKETFHTLAGAHMRLNPWKFTFGVEEDQRRDRAEQCHN